jgi:hypothetical protein
MWQVPRCHSVQDYHTVIPFQHKRSTKQVEHETKNKQKATKMLLCLQIKSLIYFSCLNLSVSTDSLCFERICFRFTANVFKCFLFFLFFFSIINILDLLIFSNAMSFFSNFYEHFQFFKMFNILFFK